MGEVPERIGKYHILQLIAQGGMAEVYKAKSIGIAGFEKILALKRMRPRYAREPRFIRNFTDEARIAVSLNHRNIVQVFDFGKADGELYLAMELLEGVDLRMATKACAAKGVTVPPVLASYVLSEVAAGLDYAHRKKDSSGNPLQIVHCDVSPHNILLSNEGFVKILDFGVARAQFTAAPTSKRLRGKPRYMAPEQTLGDTPTAASDVFVVGILAWELLAGLPLFEGRNLKEILQAVRRADVPELHKLNPDVPLHLSEAVSKALSHAPEKRGTAAELGTTLARAARDWGTKSNAQALTEWLRDLFPPEEEESEGTVTSLMPMTAPTALPDLEVTGVTMTRPKLAIVDQVTTPPTDSRADSVDDTGTPPSLAALIDKRRVVVAVLLLDGENDDRRLELQRTLSDLAYKRGAVVHEGSSDGELVAIFGLDVAGEDDIASAMHFSTDACELARDTSRDASESVTLRTAARAGVVVQRRQGNYHLRVDVLREARELARGAEPNRPLLSGGTGRLASAQYRFRELPARRYRSRRLRVLELIGPRNHNDRAQALRNRNGRFVGRVKELDALWASHERSLKGKTSGSILIAGTPGVGKSRLVAEFVARLDHSNPPHILAVAAMKSAAAAPFTIAVEFLQAGLQISPGRGERARTELLGKLQPLYRDSGLDEETVRSSCSAIELAMELRDGALTRQAQPSAAMREQLTDSIARFQVAICKGRASVTIIENIHFADVASLEVLRGVLRRPSKTAALVLMTSRHAKPIVEGFEADETIILTDLVGEERRTLIRDRLSDTSDSDEVNAVARRAGGNPLYIEELCRTIREMGLNETPATVRDTIVARVDRLSKRSRAVLQRAAVIGVSFRTQILEELIATPLAAHLQEFVEEGLLIRSDQAEVDAEDGVLAFPHGLIQEVVYSSLSAGARKATHAKLGQLLTLRVESGRDEPPAQIARHLELGGEKKEAAIYWTRAGNVSLTAFDPKGALEAFTRALTIGESKRSSSDGTKAMQIEALFGRARANRDLGNLVKQAKDLDLLGPLCVSNPAYAAELLNRKAELHLRRGNLEKAEEEAQHAVVSATQARAPLAEGEALRLLGETHERAGRFQSGLDAANKALTIFERLGDRAHELRTRISIARNHLVRGRYAEAQGIYQPILKELEKSRDPHIESIAYNHLASIHLCLGEFSDALSYLARATDLSTESCDGNGDSLSVQGMLFFQVGQHDAAKLLFDQALVLHKRTESQWSYVQSLIRAASNEGRLGNLDRAFAQVQEALKLVRVLKSPPIECSASIALAGLYLLRDGPGDLPLAEAIAEDAASHAEVFGLRGMQAIALARQAESWRRRGDTASGLPLIRAATEILDQLRRVEVAEEEILLCHYSFLAETDSVDAGQVLELAMRSIDRKLASIDNADWRRSFCEDVPVNAALLDANEQTSPD